MFACGAGQMRRTCFTTAIRRTSKQLIAAQCIRKVNHVTSNRVLQYAACGHALRSRLQHRSCALPPEREQQESSRDEQLDSEVGKSERSSPTAVPPKGVPPLPSRTKLQQARSESSEANGSKSSGSKGKDKERMKFDPPHIPAPPNQSRLSSLEQALGFMVATGGVYGTAAVALGWLSHIEPFGNFHYDRQDILTAVLIFLPVYLVDALILVPEWETEGGAAKLVRDLPISPVFRPQPPLTDPTSTPSTSSSDPPTSTTPTPSKAPTTSLPLDPPSPVPASSWGVSPLPDRIKQDWSFLDAVKIALQRTQDSYFQLNFGASLPEYLEVLVILVGVLGQELLYRGVIFTLLSGWLRDRYYEAGADDFVQITSTVLMSMEDVGKWSALGVFAAAGAASVARKVWEASQRSRVLIIPVAGSSSTPGSTSGSGSSSSSSPGKDTVDIPGAKDKDKKGAVSNQRFIQVGPRISQTMALTQLIKGGRDVMESLAACTSFLVTHNLAATWAATVLSELLFSVMQRQGIRRYRRKSNRYYKKLSQALSKTRKNLQAQQEQANSATADKTAITTELPTKPTPADPSTTGPDSATSSLSSSTSDTSTSATDSKSAAVEADNNEPPSSSSAFTALDPNGATSAGSIATSQAAAAEMHTSSSSSSSSVLSHPLPDGVETGAESASVSSSNGVAQDTASPNTSIDQIEPGRVAGCSSMLPNAPRGEADNTHGGTGSEQQDLKRLADELAGSLKQEEEEGTAVNSNSR